MPKAPARTPELPPAGGERPRRRPVSSRAPAAALVAVLLALLVAALAAAPGARAQEAPTVAVAAPDPAVQPPAAEPPPGQPSSTEPVGEPGVEPLGEPVAETAEPWPQGVEWVVSVGAFGVLDGVREGQGTVEVRLGPWTRLPLFEGLPVEPAFGLTGTTEGSAYLYSSLRFDLFQTLEWLSGRVHERGGRPSAPRHWQIVPFTGVGLYEEGDDGKALGGLVEFRSGVEVSVRVTERSRLALSFYHLSNAGIYDANPGSESLVLLWSRR
ncbi:MAG TPA: acyloxyacyl hydrolase [Thermoanaerobaculia bacterium]|nr:acyloxyacyl hydrolase [Thermoanaerobaculia bacterium]